MSDKKPKVFAAFLEEARKRNWTPPAAGSVPAPARIETAGSAPSKPRPKQKPKRKRVRAGSESEGGSSGGSSSSDDEDGKKGKDLLHTLFEDGGELYKATGHGVDGDCGRVLFYEINGDGEEEHSTVIEARGWVQEYEARNTERIN